LYIKNVKADLTFGTSGYRDAAGATGKPIGDATFSPTAQVQGDPIIGFVQNSDQAVDFQIHNLQFLVNVNEVTNLFPLLDLTNSFGFQQAPIPDLSVSSMDAQSILQTLLPVENGNWMYVSRELDEQGMTSTFVEGFYYVPEPSSVVLLGLGAVGTYIFVRRGEGPEVHRRRWGKKIQARKRLNARKGVRTVNAPGPA
jgi:PEP-CTERM motif